MPRVPRADTKTAKVKQLLAMGRWNLREIAEIAECSRTLVTSIKRETRKAQAGDLVLTRLQRLDQDVRDLRRLLLSRLGELHPAESLLQMRRAS